MTDFGETNTMTVDISSCEFNHSLASTGTQGGGHFMENSSSEERVLVDFMKLMFL